MKYALSDAEEAMIQDRIKSDPEASEATDEQLKAAMSFTEAFATLAESARRTKGRPTIANPKKQVTLRLDADILEAFRAQGTGWQGRINEALRKSLR
jgi:uncharacterized protein (DUF4415 family)